MCQSNPPEHRGCFRAHATAGGIALVAVSASVPEPTDAASAFDVGVAGIDICRMPASGSGRKYLAFIRVPGMASPASGFSIAYLTDTNLHFATMVMTFRAYAPRGNCERAVIVGTGYPPAEVPGEKCKRDLHKQTTPEGFSGPEDLHTFLLQELRPKTEGSFPVDAMRQASFGHSCDGLCVPNTLSAEPGSFGEKYLFEILSEGEQCDARFIQPDDEELASVVPASTRWSLSLFLPRLSPEYSH